MRKCFLDDLPKHNQGYVDWKNSVGLSIKFTYDDINGEFPILDYIKKGNRGFIVTEYKGNDKIEIWIGAITKCRIGSVIGSYNIDYLYKIGDIINDLKHGSLEILKQTRTEVNNNGKIRKLKSYIYKCKICGYVNEKTEDELKKNGCSVCAGNKILKGFNDLWTQRPDIAKLLKHQERGYVIGKASNTKEILICPDCRHEQTQIINNIYKQGYSCQKCGDGVSYPEKFMINFLSQLEIKFKTQKTFKWSDGKRYDFYIPTLNCIIETHGEQHYRDCGFTRTLEEEQDNDRLKERMAKENGINKYIVIDCRKSELEWIKNNILFSSLSIFYDLQKVDWKSCNKNAIQSNVKIASELWELNKTISEISKILNVHGGTVRVYLKRGAEMGWNSYNPKKESEKGIKKMANTNKKSIIQLSLKGEFIKKFESIVIASSEIKISASNIHSVLRGNTKTAAGFKWIYKDDYEHYIKNNKALIHI